jgi:hypothetical protein
VGEVLAIGRIGLVFHDNRASGTALMPCARGRLAEIAAVACRFRWLLPLAPPPPRSRLPTSEIPLWPNGAPGSGTPAELSEGGVDPAKAPQFAGLAASYTVSHNPSIYVFLPAKEGQVWLWSSPRRWSSPTRDREGRREIAEWLMPASPRSCWYRRSVPDSPWLHEHVHADAARAMRLVRSRAAAWQ